MIFLKTFVYTCLSGLRKISVHNVFGSYENLRRKNVNICCVQETKWKGRKQGKLAGGIK